MARINAAVGPGAPNRHDDVLVVQLLLERHQRWLGGASVPQATGKWDERTATALRAFQQHGAALAPKFATGRVEPSGWTMTALNKPVINGPRHRFFVPGMCFVHGPPVTPSDLQAAARQLQCEVAAITAVAKVETKRSPWFQTERPSILYERHYFRDGTEGVWNRSHPDLSGPPYEIYGTWAAQYGKIGRAAMLDEEEALKAASWGMFQIMGENHEAAGHKTIAAFVDAMLAGEREHLAAFVTFIIKNPPIHRALVAKDWTRFARGYNGPDFARNNYHTNMAETYAALTRRTGAAR